MAHWLRLKKLAGGPLFRKGDELVVYAKDDGSLHTVDSDGTDTELGAGGGGSLPDESGKAVGDLLALIASATGSTQPTVAAVDSDARTAKLLALGWTANYAYALARAEEVETATDITQFLKPTGSANVFASEPGGTNQFTGTDEPDWDGDAPNPGDSVSDNDLTWYNVGPYSAWPPTPTTWAAETEYPLGSMVWPTTPNGHLYVVYPPGPLTSDVSEPDFPTDGTYVGDGDGFWWDAGVAVELLAAWQTLQSLELVQAANPFVNMLRLFNAARTLATIFNISDEGFLNGDGTGYQLDANDDDGFSALRWFGGLGLLFQGPLFRLQVTDVPADADVDSNQVAVWLDPTHGAAKLMFKARDDNNAYVTGSVNLT